jgi:hypothetical protein
MGSGSRTNESWRVRLRIRTLEETNRQLKEQLEAAYGRLAAVQTKLGSRTKRQNDALISWDRCSEAFLGYVVAANLTFEPQQKVNVASTQRWGFTLASQRRGPERDAHLIGLFACRRILL